MTRKHAIVYLFADGFAAHKFQRKLAEQGIKASVNVQLTHARDEDAADEVYIRHLTEEQELTAEAIKEML